MADDGYHAFDDPVQDRMLGIVLALGAEVWALRDRMGLLEQALADKGVDVTDLIETMASDEGRIEAMTVERDAFVERFLRPITE